MSDDQFISRLMNETFAQEKVEQRSRSVHSEEDFHRRRGLSRLPVTAFEGNWLSPGLARFVVNGHVLDLPQNHIPFQAWSKERGQVVSGPFVAVLGQLSQHSFSHLFVVRSSDGQPWLVAWNQHKAKVDPLRLQELFSPPGQSQKKAA